MGTVKIQTVRVCRAGALIWAPQDPPWLGEATLGLQSSFPSSPLGPAVPAHALVALVTLSPGPGWVVEGEGGPGPRGGSPVPQLAGNTASLGSQSQRNSRLCFPSTRFELTEPPDYKQMFLLFLAQGSSGGGCSRFCFPRANSGGKKLGPASLWPAPAPR